MRFQSTQASCGPAALRNALRARGVHRSEEELARLAGYRPEDGTTARGLLKALRLIAADNPDIQPVTFQESRADIALLKLSHAHSRGLVVVPCVDEWSHWVVSFGTLGQIFHIADSADDEMVLHLDSEQLRARWKGFGKCPYYGIAV